MVLSLLFACIISKSKSFFIVSEKSDFNVFLMYLHLTLSGVLSLLIVSVELF